METLIFFALIATAFGFICRKMALKRGRDANGAS